MTNDQEKYDIHLKHQFLIFVHSNLMIIIFLCFFKSYSFHFRNVETVKQKLASIISTRSLY